MSDFSTIVFFLDPGVCFSTGRNCNQIVDIGRLSADGDCLLLKLRYAVLITSITDRIEFNVILGRTLRKHETGGNHIHLGGRTRTRLRRSAALAGNLFKDCLQFCSTHRLERVISIRGHIGRVRSCNLGAFIFSSGIPDIRQIIPLSPSTHRGSILPVGGTLAEIDLNIICHGRLGDDADGIDLGFDFIGSGTNISDVVRRIYYCVCSIPCKILLGCSAVIPIVTVTRRTVGKQNSSSDFAVC